jgi:hypothetical protein
MAVPNPTDLPRVLPSVVVVQQDDSDWFLVNLERGDSVAVDRAEARVFESCRKGTSVRAAAHELAQELDDGRTDDQLPRIEAAVEHFRQWGLLKTG